MVEILEDIKKDFFLFVTSFEEKNSKLDEDYLLFKERMLANLESFEDIQKQKEIW